MGSFVLLVPHRLQLEGAMGNIKVSAEAFAKPVQHLSGASLVDAGLIDDYVRGQDRYATGDRPGMQVVNVDHPAYPFHMVTHLCQIHPAWRCLQQHVYYFAQQRPGTRDDQYHDGE